MPGDGESPLVINDRLILARTLRYNMYWPAFNKADTNRSDSRKERVQCSLCI